MTDTDRIKRLKRILRHASKRSPLFQQKLAGLKPESIRDEQEFTRNVPLLRMEDLEQARSRSGDSFSGRKCQDKTADLTFQLESDTELPLYLALSRRDLQLYAQALRHCWQLIGLKNGEKVAIFDFGSSPLSYLASSFFMPYLNQGAAEGLGCIPLCNDGVSQMSQRAVEILRIIRPTVFFIRSDCIFPFSQEAKRQGISLPDYIKSVVVAGNEDIPSTHSCLVWASALGVPVHRLLRVDAAMFLGVDCPTCNFLHISNDLYFVETTSGQTGGSYGKSPYPSHRGRANPGPVEKGDLFRENYLNSPGQLTITNLYARLTPSIRYVSQVRGVMVGQGCPQAPEDDRVQLL